MSNPCSCVYFYLSLFLLVCVCVKCFWRDHSLIFNRRLNQQRIVYTYVRMEKVAQIKQPPLCDGISVCVLTCISRVMFPSKSACSYMMLSRVSETLIDMQRTGIDKGCEITKRSK